MEPLINPGTTLPRMPAMMLKWRIVSIRVLYPHTAVLHYGGGTGAVVDEEIRNAANCSLWRRKVSIHLLNANYIPSDLSIID